jgi:hypothetical protein
MHHHHHHLRRGLLALVAITLLLATAGPVAAAQRAQPARFAPIAGQLDGRTGAQLMADSFVPDYVGGSTTPPGECQRLGRHDRVVWLTDVFTCQLRPGDVPVALVGASCSDVEAPPFFAVGEAAQRACAREWNAGLLSMTLAVDGCAPVQLTRRAFSVSPPQRRVVIPADNPAGYPAGPATFTADGWAAELTGLTRGTHTVDVVAIFDGLDEPVTETFTLVVAAYEHS